MSLGAHLKLLGLTVLVLVEIAASVAVVNNIVRFRSGINNNDTLRRLWSKPDAVIFQPVLWPLALSALVCLGINYLARSIMIGFLEVIDAVHVAQGLSWSAGFAATVTGTFAGALAGRIVYVLNGGALLYVQVAGALALSLFPALVGVLAAPPSVIAISVVIVCVITLVSSVWVNKIVASKAHSQQVRELRPSLNVLAASYSRWYVATVIVCCVALLVLLRLADFAVVWYVRPKKAYLALVLRNFSGLMVLVACCFVAIVLTNLSVMNSLFVWQWPCMLVPMAALLPVEIVAQTVYARPHASVLQRLAVLIQHDTMYAAAGYLGAAFYLGVLARAAKIALDPGFDGQSELILDDDSDYELDA